MVQALARGLVARGHSVTVLGVYAQPWPGRTVDEGVTVVRLPHTNAPGGGFFINGARLRRAVARIHAEQPIDVLEGAEVGLAFMPRHSPYATVIRMNGGHHFFAVTLGARPRPWPSWLERRSFARASHLCAVSRFVGDETTRLLGLQGREIEVIPNPVDVTRFSPSPSAEEPGLIVFAGTLCEKKGIRQLLLAMPRILEAVPGARLLVCGHDSFDQTVGGSFLAHLKRSLPPSVAERVVFHGPVPHAQLPDMLARAAVCTYPSHMEALPLAWLEGLSMGKAVVASSTGPGREVIEHGVSGLLCDPHDPQSIASQIIAVLSDAALRERLGRQARDRAVGRFSLERLVERNEAFYRRASEAGPSRASRRGVQPMPSRAPSATGHPSATRLPLP